MPFPQIVHDPVTDVFALQGVPSRGLIGDQSNAVASVDRVDVLLIDERLFGP